MLRFVDSVCTGLNATWLNPPLNLKLFICYLFIKFINKKNKIAKTSLKNVFLLHFYNIYHKQLVNYVAMVTAAAVMKFHKKASTLRHFGKC